MDYVRDGNCKLQIMAKFNVAFVINMLLKRKKFLGVFFVVFLQKIKTHSQILGKKLETVTSETLKIKTQ